jgi:uncharacterized protein (TIGR02453 family)
VTGFAGFTTAALDFYDDLELDNTKSYWEAHKAVYAEHVRRPMESLMSELESEFGAAKIFRPYRDVRFAKDKTPYKTNQGAFVRAGEATGWYLDLSAAGFRVGGGFYHAEAEVLDRYRRAVADSVRGPELEALLAKLRRRWEIGGDRLKRSPRGFDHDHPRIELLRHRSLVASQSYGFEPVIHSADLVARVRKDWRQLRPLVDWISANVSG